MDFISYFWNLLPPPAALLPAVWNQSLQFAFLLLLIIAPLPLAACSTVLSWQGARKPLAFAHNLLILSLSWCALQTALGLFLGLAHLLSPLPLILGEILLLISGLLLRPTLIQNNPQCDPFKILTLSEKLKTTERLIIAAIVTLSLLLLIMLAKEPTTDYDSNIMHFPVMVHWYQSGNIEMQDQPEFAQHNSYPYGWELLATLFLFPFSEDFLVFLPNLLAWGIFGLSIYLIARQIGAQKTHSLAGAVFAMTLPVTIEHVSTMHIDLPLAATYLAATYLALLHARTRSWSILALLLATVGLCLGIKISAVTYLLLLLVFWIALLLTTRKSSTSDAQAIHIPRPILVSYCLIGLIVFSLVGGYWYIKNCFVIGNPLGLVQLKVLGIEVLSGSVHPKDLYMTSLLYNFRPTAIADWKVLNNLALTQLHFPFFSAAALSLLTLLAFFKRQGKLNRLLLGAFIFLSLGALYLYISTPHSGISYPQKTITDWCHQAIRFGFTFLGTLAVLAALGATAAHIPAPVTTLLALTSTLLTFRLLPFFNRPPLLVYGSLDLELKTLFFLLLLGLSARPPIDLLSRKPLSRIVLAIPVLLLIFGLALLCRHERDTRRTEISGHFHTYLEEHIDKKETIGHIFCLQTFQLCGKRFQRSVLPVLRPEIENQAEWLEYLKANQVKTIAIGPITKGWMEYPYIQKRVDWLTDPEGHFEPLLGHDIMQETLLFRLKSSKTE